MMFRKQKAEDRIQETGDGKQGTEDRVNSFLDCRYTRGSRSFNYLVACDPVALSSTIFISSSVGP